jgi:coenzyme PQQ precursor peptide PqqA
MPLLGARNEAGADATASKAGSSSTRHVTNSNTPEVAMWSKPEYTEMRFGFEVTMYIANR